MVSSLQQTWQSEIQILQITARDNGQYGPLQLQLQGNISILKSIMETKLAHQWLEIQVSIAKLQLQQHFQTHLMLQLAKYLTKKLQQRYIIWHQKSMEQVVKVLQYTLTGITIIGKDGN